jgi:hypothetical protein
MDHYYAAASDEISLWLSLVTGGTQYLTQLDLNVVVVSMHSDSQTLLPH